MKRKFDTYFHLGLPKVASTFLQKEIFPNLTNIHFHRKRKFNDYKDLDASNLDADHLFSSERDWELETTASEIMTVLPEAKFMIVVRRQDKWILSKYKYYIRKHGWESFENFFDIETDKGIWKQEQLYFHKKIEYLDQHAKTRPLVLSLTLLKENPDLFFSRITEFTNTHLDPKARKNLVINKAFNEKQLIVLRSFNRFYPYKTATGPSKFLNKVHYKYREFLLHTVAFLSRFIPTIFFRNNSLLNDPEVLNKIRKFYQEDWANCLAYSNAKETV